MTTPILILNFNREAPLRRLLQWSLQLDGAGDVWIVDNASSWPATLALYDELPRWAEAPRLHVVRMGANLGLDAVPAFLARHPFDGRVVITDPDLVPYPHTPRDLLTVAHAVLDDYPDVHKAGAGLEIDDVPRDYFNREWLDFWERRLWALPLLPCRRGRRAPVDTTFALYRSADLFRREVPSVRLDRPYVLQHVDWYEPSAQPSEEFLHYSRKCGRDASGIVHWKRWRKSPESHDDWLRRRTRKGKGATAG